MRKQLLRLEDAPDLLKVEEFGRLLRIGKNSAYGLIRSGRVAHVRIGRAIRVPKEAVRRFLEGGSGAPRGDAA